MKGYEVSTFLRGWAVNLQWLHRQGAHQEAQLSSCCEHSLSAHAAVTAGISAGTTLSQPAQAPPVSPVWLQNAPLS